MNARLSFTLATALFAAACGNDPRPKVEPTPEPAADPSAAKPEAPAATPAATDPSAEELPLPQDFESEVAEQITAQNFRAELERLEREIAAQQQK